MKSGIRDGVEGAAKEVKGAVKEKIGKTTGDVGMTLEGKLDRGLGKAQQKTGQIKRDALRD